MTELQLMDLAIQMAAQCRPSDPKRVPKVGAVIARNGVVMAQASRGEDEHAEKIALSKVANRDQLPGSTVFTTLEPCTRDVRSKPEESCTRLLVDAQVQRVVIGILDPNQGVCGKGVLDLQEHKIDVALFPLELAQRIRLLNDEFVRAQRTLGIRIMSPAPNNQLHTYKTNGKQTFLCECINAPGSDVYVLTERNGVWWPQPTTFRHKSGNTFEFDAWFGTTGPHRVRVVRANELGAGLIAYYRKVAEANLKQGETLREMGLSKDQLTSVRQWYTAFSFGKLPRGLDIQDSIDVEVMPNPAQKP